LRFCAAAISSRLTATILSRMSLIDTFVQPGLQ